MKLQRGHFQIKSHHISSVPKINKNILRIFLNQLQKSTLELEIMKIYTKMFILSHSDMHLPTHTKGKETCKG